MRFQAVLFWLVAILVALLALANLPTLLRPTTMNLFFLGDYVLPARLFGLVALLGVALVFRLASGFQGTRAKADAADYLKRIDELRRSLDKEEAGRFAALRTALDEHVRTLGNRIDALDGALAARQETLATGFAARVERARDELSADIAAAEDSLLRAQAGRPPGR